MKFEIGDKARVCDNAPIEIIYITEEEANAVIDGDFSKSRNLRMLKMISCRIF